MRPRLTFRPAARTELREARRWYDEQVPGLGRAFIAEVEVTLTYAQLHPRLYPAVEGDDVVRRALLHRFPYRLIYEIFPDGELVVIACRHVRQDAVDWRRRRGDA